MRYAGDLGHVCPLGATSATVFMLIGATSYRNDVLISLRACEQAVDAYTAKAAHFTRWPTDWHADWPDRSVQHKRMRDKILSER